MMSEIICTISLLAVATIGIGILGAICAIAAITGWHNHN